jgi:uncharacterized membrane protein YecN with MAPEG domain
LVFFFPFVAEKQKTVIISAHGDTNWKNHSMVIRECPNGNGQEYHGHMDNFGGVHAVMNVRTLVVFVFGFVLMVYESRRISVASYH